MDSIPQIARAYYQANRRLLLLDYDGTLREFEPTPPQASPTDDIFNLLKLLGSDQKNTVVIISGRDHGQLDDWFGHLPVSMSGEHGLLVKDIGAEWEPLAQLDLRWKDEVRTIIRSFVEKIDHSMMEEKVASIAWHYRNADQTAAEAAIPKLRSELTEAAEEYSLTIRNGTMVVEIGCANVNKGIAAAQFIDQRRYDFILSVGDEATDEDMFNNMPESAFCIKVGPAETAAKYHLKDPDSVRKFLRSLSVR